MAGTNVNANKNSAELAQALGRRVESLKSKFLRAAGATGSMTEFDAQIAAIDDLKARPGATSADIRAYDKMREDLLRSKYPAIYATRPNAYRDTSGAFSPHPLSGQAGHSIPQRLFDMTKDFSKGIEPYAPQITTVNVRNELVDIASRFATTTQTGEKASAITDDLLRAATNGVYRSKAERDVYAKATRKLSELPGIKPMRQVMLGGTSPSGSRIPGIIDEIQEWDAETRSSWSNKAFYQTVPYDPRIFELEQERERLLRTFMTKKDLESYLSFHEGYIGDKKATAVFAEGPKLKSTAYAEAMDRYHEASRIGKQYREVGAEKSPVYRDIVSQIEALKKSDKAQTSYRVPADAIWPEQGAFTEMAESQSIYMNRYINAIAIGDQAAADQAYAAAHAIGLQMESNPEAIRAAALHYVQRAVTSNELPDVVNPGEWMPLAFPREWKTLQRTGLVDASIDTTLLDSLMHEYNVTNMTPELAVDPKTLKMNAARTFTIPDRTVTLADGTTRSIPGRAVTSESSEFFRAHMELRAIADNPAMDPKVREGAKRAMEKAGEGFRRSLGIDKEEAARLLGARSYSNYAQRKMNAYANQLGYDMMNKFSGGVRVSKSGTSADQFFGDIMGRAGFVIGTDANGRTLGSNATVAFNDLTGSQYFTFKYNVEGVVETFSQAAEGMSNTGRKQLDAVAEAFGNVYKSADDLKRAATLSKMKDAATTTETYMKVLAKKLISDNAQGRGTTLFDKEILERLGITKLDDIVQKVIKNSPALEEAIKNADFDQAWPILMKSIMREGSAPGQMPRTFQMLTKYVATSLVYKDEGIAEIFDIALSEINNKAQTASEVVQTAAGTTEAVAVKPISTTVTKVLDNIHELRGGVGSNRGLAGEPQRRILSRDVFGLKRVLDEAEILEKYGITDADLKDIQKLFVDMSRAGSEGEGRRLLANILDSAIADTGGGFDAQKLQTVLAKLKELKLHRAIDSNPDQSFSRVAALVEKSMGEAGVSYTKAARISDTIGRPMGSTRIAEVIKEITHEMGSALDENTRAALDRITDKAIQSSTIDSVVLQKTFDELEADSRTSAIAKAWQQRFIDSVAGPGSGTTKEEVLDYITTQVGLDDDAATSIIEDAIDVAHEDDLYKDLDVDLEDIRHGDLVGEPAPIDINNMSEGLYSTGDDAFEVINETVSSTEETFRRYYDAMSAAEKRMFEEMLDMMSLNEATMTDIAKMGIARRSKEIRSYVLGSIYENVTQQQSAAARLKYSQLVDTLATSDQLSNVRYYGVTLNSTVDNTEQGRFLIQSGLNSQGEMRAVPWRISQAESGHTIASPVSGAEARSLLEIHAGLPAANLQAANPTVWGSTAAMNQQLKNLGIEQASYDAAARRMVPLMNSDVTSEELMRAISYGERHQSELDSWRVNISQAVMTADSMESDVMPTVSRSVSPYEWIAQQAEHVQAGREIPEEIIDSFAPQAREIDNIIHMARTDKAFAAAMGREQKLFDAGKGMVPELGLAKLMNFAKEAPTMTKVAIGAIAITGMAVAHRMMERDTGENTERMLQYEHPGSAGTTRIVSNESGYANASGFRGIPSTPGGVTPQQMVRGYKATMVLSDNFAGMSANDLDRM